MNKHEHAPPPPQCQHNEVKVCHHCDVVYCTACPKEWGTMKIKSSPFPTFAPIVIGRHERIGTGTAIPFDNWPISVTYTSTAHAH